MPKVIYRFYLCCVKIGLKAENKRLAQGMKNETTEIQGSKNVLFRKIGKIVGIVVGVFVLILFLAFGYLYFNQDKIKNIITQNLNAQLATEVSVGAISIDFFGQFPDVSVRFSNVRAEEAVAKPEQALFIFKNIYVRFGLWSLIDGNYTIRKLTFDEGEVNLRILPNQSDNWHFWRESEGESTESKTAIALEDVVWQRAKLRYLDENMRLQLLFWVEDFHINGALQSGALQADVDGQLVLQDLTYENLDLADSVQLSTDLTLQTDATQTVVTLRKMLVNQVVCNGLGKITEHIQNWNLTTTGTPVRNWLTLIPKQWRPSIDPVDLGGESDANISIKLDAQTTDVQAEIELLRAELELEAQHLLLKNTTGSISFGYVATGNKTKTALNFSDIKADTRSGTLALNATISDLMAPAIVADGRLKIDLEELLAITRPGLVDAAKGTVSGNFSYAQKFSSWDELSNRAFAEPKLEGQLELSGGSVKLANSNLHFKDLSAAIEMRNKDLVINRLFGREGKSEFMIDGWFYNALYFAPNRPVPTLSVRLQSQYIDLDRLMEWQMPKRAAEDSTYSADRTTPMALNFNMMLDVKEFNFIRFSGYNLTGEVWNDGLKIKGKQIEFLGLDGAVKGNFAWSTEPDGYRFWTQGNLDKIDIHQLFSGFENFGQDWLLADNIYGIGSTQLETSMAFDVDLNFIPSSLKLASNIVIENGRLVGYKPLLSLNSIVESKDLEDVRFSRMENQISIADEVISIPQMEINSSALNLVLLGRHSFDQQIDYSIRLALADVIKKKKPKKGDLDDWIEEVENTNQPYIWVHVGCTVDDPCLSLDRELLKKGVKDEWKQQGEDLRNIFKPDPKDEKPKDPNKGELIFEWDESGSDSTDLRLMP